MKYPIRRMALMLLLAGSSIGYAQEVAKPSNQIRMDFSYNDSTRGLTDGYDDIFMSETSLESIFTWQTKQGVYAQAGFGRFNMYELDVNGAISDLDFDYNSRMFGLGYRIARKGALERFWGFGLQNSKDTAEGAEDPEAINTLRTFWEKDNSRRYGIIELAYATNEILGLLSVSGRHVWFAKNGFGLGVNWGVGSGYYDTPPGSADVSTGVAKLGAVLMFRPKF